jgi:hypothetical protein
MPGPIRQVTTMQLPFSREAFLDVFAVYNTWLWPVAAILWLATAVAAVAHARGRPRATPILGLLAVQWAWAGLAYHAALFAWINSAAWLFAAAFLVEAGLLFRHGVMQDPRPLSRAHTVRKRVACIHIAYGLIYPAVALAGGEMYPYAPTFGVPCPTTIVTAGFLMLVAPRTLSLAFIPVSRAVVGGSAAFLLRMPADFGLISAGVALGVSSWPRRTTAGHFAVRRHGNFSRIG